jgi:phospholipase A1
MKKVLFVIYYFFIGFTTIIINIPAYGESLPASSILAKKQADEKRTHNNPLSLTLYNPTYVLPYYYTRSPYYQLYQGNTPDNQKVMHNEFKAQLSFLVPVVSNLFNDPDSSFDIAYTQLNYWQVYAHSQYFRETNYEPEIFVRKYFHQNWLFQAGLDHQSNGRGGALERSWNRAVFSAQVSGNNWLVGLKTWTLIFQGESSSLHNPDISHYLGYENIIFAHKIQKAVFSLELQNLESGLKRGYVSASASYPLSKNMSFYAQYFNGYGQSLIEYNHRTQGAGVGISFNNWI